MHFKCGYSNVVDLPRVQCNQHYVNQKEDLKVYKEMKYITELST